MKTWLNDDASGYIATTPIRLAVFRIVAPLCLLAVRYKSGIPTPPPPSISNDFIFLFFYFRKLAPDTVCNLPAVVLPGAELMLHVFYSFDGGADERCCAQRRV